MKKRIFTMLVLILTLLGLCALSAGAQTETDYAVISNSVFEAEQGNLFSTEFGIVSDNRVEVLEFHLAYDKSMAELSSTEVFTIGENTSIKYNDKLYLVVSEIYEGEPEYYFFEPQDGCTDADKRNLTLEGYYTNARYPEVFSLVENQAENNALMSHIHANYGMIIYDAEIRINASYDGVISVSWLPRDPSAVSGSTMFSLQFTIDANLAAADYDNWLTVYTGKRSFVDAPGGKELDLTVNISPVSIYEYGDINFDTYIDTRDALLARQHSLEIINLTGLKRKYADVNGDNLVNTTDALQIQQKTIGIKDHVGNRYNVYFHDIDGNICAVKSVAAGQTILSVPKVPNPKGYINGEWSVSSEELVSFDFESGIDREVHLYAFYEIRISELMQYYVDTLQLRYNSTYNRGVTLDSTLHYGGSSSDTEAEITWYYIEDDGTTVGVPKNEAGQYVLDQPGYNTTMVLKAYIVSWKDGELESQNSIDVEVKLKGKFSTPTKAEIVRYLRELTGGNVGDSSVTGGVIETDLVLPVKITNNEIGAENSYEVRLAWYQNVDGTEEPISEIKRTTSTQEGRNYVCRLTFNGVPLEGDGKVYFDNVTLAPITEMEIRAHIIDSISASTPRNITDGTELWTEDDTYGTLINWYSNNTNIISITGNVASVPETAVSGENCPVTVTVEYVSEGEKKSFDLGYILSVVTSNSTLNETNMDPSFYYALLDILDVKQLTTDHLKKTEFVALDLTPYSVPFKNGAGELCSPITNLKGISYCENLRLLNISGLNLSAEGFNELTTLNKLETLIARDCSIETLKFGDFHVTSQMANLKLLDLSHNNINTLDEILDQSVTYNKLREVYLNHNQITDINALNRAPLLSVAELSNNQIEDISVLSNNPYLTKLSLSNNKITSLTGLQYLKLLTELRLQNNSISSIRDISDLTSLKALYLGDNEITDISYLKNLTAMVTLYLNNNEALETADVLADMVNLEVLHISGCSIRDFSGLDRLVNMRELYAEDNNIGSISFVRQWPKLEKLLLARNNNFDESSRVSDYLAPLENLTTLTLSGRPLKDLSFLKGTDDAGETVIKPIVRLEIADCSLDAYVATSYDADGGIMEYVDNISLLMELISTLKYCDISGNNLDMDSSQDTFYDDGPLGIAEIRMLSNLRALYINNTDLGASAADITSSMSRLTHLSMENCGITDLGCIKNNSYLEFVDLANNPIATCDFSMLNRNFWGNIQYMYLDTTAEAAKMLDPAETVISMGQNNLLALSLEGYSVPSASYLPNMDSIRYLNLQGTGMSDLMGTDTYQTNGASNQYSESIFRFTDTLQVLDLATIGVFTHDNLNMLYNEINGKGITLYLYEDESIPGFDAQREMDHIVQYWDDSQRTMTKSEFTLVEGYIWKADFAAFVEEYLGFNLLSWSITDAGTGGAFSTDGTSLLLDDSKYGFDSVATFGTQFTVNVYEAANALATVESTFHVEPAERATITVIHRYWSITDSKNGSYSTNSGSQEVVETYQVITGKTNKYTAVERSGYRVTKQAEEFCVDGDKTVIFDYPRMQYNLVLNANGGNLPVGSAENKAVYTTTLYYGELTDLFDASRTTGSGGKGVKSDYFPTRTDYLFYSWYNGSTRIADNFTMPASDVTLTADWVYAIYTATTGKKWTEAREDYLDWYDHAISLNSGIGAEEWIKLCEYGNTNVAIKIVFDVIEDDKGYQSLRVDSYTIDGSSKKIHEYKDYEAAGNALGSETFTENKTASRDDIRQGWLVYLGCHGSSTDNYWGTVTITTTFTSKY